MVGILTAGVLAMAASVASCAGAVKWRKHRRRKRRHGGGRCKGGCLGGCVKGPLAGVNPDALRAEVTTFEGASAQRTREVPRAAGLAPGVQVGGAALEGFKAAVLERAPTQPIAEFGAAILPLVLQPQDAAREAEPEAKPLPFGPAVVRLGGQTGTKEAQLPILRAPVRFEEV
ncbi:hypothetical protein [Stigmatella erecta]|uniref:Uncharacterized protein n=1 Tax=Stigmatella erecta TaxID=83460 RepID=A0A1I0LBP6_9BACT|nr:hypothetical protein [Stigmatella erecta]SEU36949.1 hypothetical protein SAMN05443639_12320 [Stigmatella erecta]